MERRIDTLIIALAVMLLAGCGGGTQRPWGTLKECEDENTKLSTQNQHLEIQNTQLKKTVAVSLELDKDVRFETLDTLETIRISKHTGLYDKDENGTKETLVVYLEPLDTAQDHIKAVGTVKIELWNLNAPEGKAKLTEWTIKPAELHTSWGGTIFRSYYRLSFAIADILSGQEKELTVKATFTDLLSGKVLSDQTTIAP